MTGTRLLIGSTLLLVVGLLVGSIMYPTTTAMSLADTSPLFTAIRSSIVVLLVWLLLTKPPRSYALRIGVGAWALALATLTVVLLFSYQIRVFDAIIFLEVAVIFAVEALESRISIPVDKKPSQRHRIPVATN